MKYFFIKNIYMFKKVFLKSFFIQSFALALYLLIDYKLLKYLNLNEIQFYLGLFPFQECSNFDIIIKLLLIFNVIFITYKVYLSYVTYGSSNTLLRINSKKIFFYIFISIFAYILLLRITYHIIILLLILLSNNLFILNISYVCIFIYDILFYLLFSILSISFINFLCDKKYVLLGILAIILFGVNIFYHLNIYFIIICILFLFIINFLIFKVSYIYNFYFKK